MNWDVTVLLQSISGHDTRIVQLRVITVGCRLQLSYEVKSRSLHLCVCVGGSNSNFMNWLYVLILLPSAFFSQINFMPTTMVYQPSFKLFFKIQ